MTVTTLSDMPEDAASPTLLLPSEPPNSTTHPKTMPLKTVLLEPTTSTDGQRSSLKVPKGERTEKSPFEIELKKGLFPIGAKLILNEMGMIVIDSLSSRSIVSQDGNIRQVVTNYFREKLLNPFFAELGMCCFPLMIIV